MGNDIVQSSRDWLSSPRTSASAWWIPKGVIVAALFIPPLPRTGVWIIALIWMGTACILNSRRCGRTHCRYTGPYYLVMNPAKIMIRQFFFFGIKSCPQPSRSQSSTD
jgi:hypothetical protein